MKGFLGALILVAGLAACGGGGGSSLPPTSGGGGTQTSAKLNAGFLSTGSSNIAATRRSITMHRLTSSLGGGILPFAIFFVPDSYVTTSDIPTITYQAVGYLTGGTPPSPLPSVTFSQTGTALQFLGTTSSVSDLQALPSGASVVGAENVGAPTTVGQTTVTIDAASLGQSVNILADTFPLSLVSSASGSSLNGPAGLTFTTSGAAPTTSGTPDLAISVGSPSSFTAPGGIIEVDNTSIDEVTGSNYVAGSAVTSLSSSTVCSITGGPTSFILKAQSGLLVKLELISVAGPNVAPSPCTYTDVEFLYQVSNSSGGFAY